jgi:neutral ceramidase
MAAQSGKEVVGPIKSILQWIDMTKQQVILDDGSVSNTCPAAMGYSFAAGTTDGPGEFDFTQVYSWH